MSVEYRKKYKTTAFPSHLIIDQKGELTHKFVGFHGPNEFLAELRKGLNDEKNLQHYNSKYAAGERSPEFMSEYLAMLVAANEGEAAGKLAAGYLNTLTIDQLSTRQNFFFVNEFVRDVDSELAQKVMKNKDKFIKSVGENDYLNYVYMLWSIKADSYVKEVNGKKSFDKKGYDAAMQKMKASGFKGADMLILVSTVRNAQRMEDWESFLNLTTDYMRKSGAQASLMLTCNWGSDIKPCPDKSIKKKYAAAMMANYELIKQSGSKDAIAWDESMEVISEELFN